MVKEARQQAIIRYLHTVDVASSQDLMRVANASSATVRRDLEELQERNKIERVFGGARLTQHERNSIQIDEPFDNVLTNQHSEKLAIATLAAQQITEGSSIFIEAGTSTFALIDHLPQVRLTVVTNSFRVAAGVIENDNIDLVMLGGEINRNYRCTYGSAALTHIAKLHIDTAFIGCSGINDRGDVRDNDPNSRDLKMAARKAAHNLFVLADRTKFPGIGTYHALSAHEIDTLITDSTPPFTIDTHILEAGLS